MCIRDSSQVARLEEFPRVELEQLGPRQVARYRGEILPLVDVSQELANLSRDERSDSSRGRVGQAADSSETVAVIVYGSGEDRVGLIVAQVIDIVQDQPSSRSRADRPGVHSTAILQGKVTEFIDVSAIVRNSIT